ncbi:MAG: primosomal protein N' [Bryobacter sp.]|nr:primosomal protein N' [Bryobacter sp.]
MPNYCDVSLPVPLDKAFTYLAPHQELAPGMRVLVSFGTRKLAGTVLRVHQEAPAYKVKPIEKVLDPEPVFDQKLLELGIWIARYYFAPVGEVFRVMAPLGGEVKRSKVFRLTAEGLRQLQQSALDLGEETEPGAQILKLLEPGPVALSVLQRKVPEARKLTEEFRKRGWLESTEEAGERDPLRAPSNKLLVGSSEQTPGEEKLTKWERELLAYLHLHPGVHALDELEEKVKNAGTSARALARRGLLKITPKVGAIRQPEDRGRPVLNPQQQAAFAAIRTALEKKQFEAFLLQGVTGSGKTEVYLNAIEAALALGRSALLLVPEIALTPQVAGQFALRFGNQVAILHSAFSEAERAEYWRRIRRGEAKVVVGTRSAVFAPMPDLGLLLVDEEHDGSYKQEETPRYHGRDVAVVRAQQIGAVVVLGSATPSLESRYNVEMRKYSHLRLTERIAQRPMPVVETVDMNQEFLATGTHALFSRRMVDAVREKLAAKEQAMLLMNRRGFSSFCLCRSCGYRVGCVNCSVTLTYHKRDRRLLCHYCGYSERVPETCKECGSDKVQFFGAGSERIEEELAEAFPTARIARMDRDTIHSKNDYEAILGGFRDGQYDILVGTQMIAKGHDIPNVTLVGIVNADLGLSMPDFRAAERTFQLLTQASGRAGRGGLPGRVILQTINPEHYAVRFSVDQDYDAFYAKELTFRRMMRYPPFASLANVLFRSEKQEEALRMSGVAAELLSNEGAELRVLGPAEAPVAKVKKEFRYLMLLKSPQRKKLAEALARLRAHAEQEEWPATGMIIDVDPLSLL